MEQMICKNTDNENKPRKTAWMIVAIAAILTLINALVYQCSKADVEEKITTDTVYQSDTIMATDTFCFYQPVPKYEMLERWDTLFLPEPKDTVPIPLKRVQYQDSVLKDNGATVKYFASVSGYEPNLDTLNFDVEYPMITNTEYVTTTIEKLKPAPRLSIGPSVGFGYGFFNKNVDLYAGLSVTYRF